MRGDMEHIESRTAVADAGASVRLKLDGAVACISKREISLSGTFLQLFVRKGGKK